MYRALLLLWQAFALLAALLFYLEGDDVMYVLGNLISMLDCVLNTNRKRHIAGGILLSVSTLFGGLALTVMTVKTDEEVDGDE